MKGGFFFEEHGYVRQTERGLQPVTREKTEAGNISLERETTTAGTGFIGETALNDAAPFLLESREKNLEFACSTLSLVLSVALLRPHQRPQGTLLVAEVQRVQGRHAHWAWCIVGAPRLQAQGASELAQVHFQHVQDARARQEAVLSAALQSFSVKWTSIMTERKPFAGAQRAKAIRNVHEDRVQGAPAPATAATQQGLAKTKEQVALQSCPSVEPEADEAFTTAAQRRGHAHCVDVYNQRHGKRLASGSSSHHQLVLVIAPRHWGFRRDPDASWIRCELGANGLPESLRNDGLLTAKLPPAHVAHDLDRVLVLHSRHDHIQMSLVTACVEPWCTSVS